MCDMTQFVVVVPIPNETSTTLADHSMQHILLNFGIYYLVILDDDSPFKCVFSAMYKTLYINFDILPKINHAGLLVETFHSFINKFITIAAEDRGTNDVFVASGDLAGYVWNASPIYRTNIIRSVPAIGRELYFHLDI